MKSGIYKITNTVNGKSYIGQSRNIKSRWVKHKCPSNEAGRVMKRAILKYGWESFRFEVIEYCHESMLDDREVFHISLSKPEYNMTSGGTGCGGMRHSEETRALLSKLGKIQWSRMSHEERVAAKENLTGQPTGHIVSEETRKKISQKLKDYYSTHKTSDLQRKMSKEINSRLKVGNTCGKRGVAMVDKDTGETIRVFDMMKDAAKFVGLASSICIRRVCQGKLKTAGGYSWIYLA